VDGLPTTVDTGSVALVPGQDHITFLLGTSYDYTGNQGGVFRVAQSGSTWSGTCILRGWITGLWIDPGHAGTWYAAASGALKRTSDAGITWETVLSGEVGAMAFSRDGTCAYAGMGSTLYCSTDSGASWNVVLWDRSADPCVPSSITCILIDDAQPLNTIIGTAGTGIYRCQRAQTVPASGTVNVVATLDGSPWTGSVNVRASGALNKTVTAVPFTEGDVPEGDLTLARVSGGPSGANFVGISPSVRQAVVAGGTTTFTLAFETPPPPVSVVVVLKIGSGIATVGGRAVTLDAPAEIATGRTFVPLRFIAEAFGAQIEWNPVSRGIIAELDGHRVGLQIANQSGVVNGAMMRLDAPPYIRNGRTMVPLRFISEAFGADVQWDPVTRTVTITYTPT